MPCVHDHAQVAVCIIIRVRTLEGFLQVDVEEPGDVLRAVAHRQRRDAHGARTRPCEATHARHHARILQRLKRNEKKLDLDQSALVQYRILQIHLLLYFMEGNVFTMP